MREETLSQESSIVDIVGQDGGQSTAGEPSTETKTIDTETGKIWVSYQKDGENFYGTISDYDINGDGLKEKSYQVNVRLGELPKSNRDKNIFWFVWNEQHEVSKEDLTILKPKEREVAEYIIKNIWDIDDPTRGIGPCVDITPLSSLVAMSDPSKYLSETYGFKRTLTNNS